MKQTTKRFVSMIAALVMLVAAFVIYVNFIVGAYGEVQSVKGDVLSRQNLIDNQSAAVNQVQKLIDAYKGEGQLSQVVSLALPSEDDVAGALAQLNGLAATDNLSPQIFLASASGVKNLVSGGAAAGTNPLVKPVGTVAFQVKLIGSYGDFKDFLGKIETNVRLFDIQSVSIQPAGKPGQDLFAYDATISAYYQSQ